MKIDWRAWIQKAKSMTSEERGNKTCKEWVREWVVTYQWARPPLWMRLRQEGRP